MMKEIDLKEIANGKIASRIKQVVVLVAIILVGIMISLATQAQPPKHFKAKYACSKLSKKRNQSENMKVAQASIRKPKYKPMAEIEAPKYYRPSAKVEKPSKTKEL
jgi:hypothetical protein